MKLKTICTTSALGLILSLSSCKKGTESKAQKELKPNPGKELVMKSIDAHGGIEKWQNSGALQFRWQYHMTDRGVVIDSTQTVNLKTFEAVHTTPDNSTTFGRNAEGKYWISPATATFAPPVSFWTLTPIYFLGVPFVFDDPQVNFKLLSEKKEFQGKAYTQVELTYNSDAGESPDDLYVLLIDDKTNLVRGMYYTVTNPVVYKGGPLVKKFITLDDLKEVNGLLLSSNHATYKMKDGVIGEQMRSTKVSDIKFVDPKKVDFTTPKDAKIFE